MLDELSERAEPSKLVGIRSRLESKRVDQALPAEMELGVLWALSQLGELEVEPEWFGTRQPDAYTESLFAGMPCAVEVTAISDARLSQEDEMRRIAAQLCEFANSARKGSGRHLHFTFGVESGYTAQGYVRRRKIDPDFMPNDETKATLRSWLQESAPRSALTIKQGNTHLVVQWHKERQSPMYNFFSSMPAEVLTPTEN